MSILGPRHQFLLRGNPFRIHFIGDLFQIGEMQTVGLAEGFKPRGFHLCFSLKEFLLMLALDYALALKGET